MNDAHTTHTAWAGFRHVNLGHVLTMITMVVTALAAFTTYDRRMTKTDANLSSITEAVNRVVDKVTLMDNVGTQASQRGILKDTEQVISNTRRIEGTEKVVAELAPKVERMDTNLDWITKWIQRQENDVMIRRSNKDQNPNN